MADDQERYQALRERIMAVIRARGGGWDPSSAEAYQSIADIVEPGLDVYTIPETGLGCGLA